MKLQMMDYSLLLGVHDCELAEQENRERLERPEGDRHLKKFIFYNYGYFCDFSSYCLIGICLLN